MFRLHSVTKAYAGRNEHPVEALRDVDLEVASGEFLTVVGPSGSGKSTLLFTIGAMLRPTAGEVRLGDTDVYALPASRRTALRRTHIGFMFQTFNLIPYLGCLENVALPAVLAGASRQQGLGRAHEILARLGLDHRLDHRPAELSVGERQRVALCRSLVNGPELLLADEPTGNLDSAMAEEVCRVLGEFNREGQTIIVVTHDPRLSRIGTRVIGLEAGRIVNDEHTSERGRLNGAIPAASGAPR